MYLFVIIAIIWIISFVSCYMLLRMESKSFNDWTNGRMLVTVLVSLFGPIGLIIGIACFVAENKKFADWNNKPCKW